MNVAPVVDRLAEQVPTLRLVGGAAQFERALQGLTAMPAAFVLPARESASEGEFMSQLVQQQVTAEFAVVIACRNLADSEGAAALEALDPIRVAVRDALLGWAPADHDGCEYVAGEFAEFANGVLWWTDTYRTAYLIRST